MVAIPLRFLRIRLVLTVLGIIILLSFLILRLANLLVLPSYVNIAFLGFQMTADMVGLITMVIDAALLLVFSASLLLQWREMSSGGERFLLKKGADTTIYSMT
jgi:hypothetical protein